jgi:hypothetical protein
MKKERSTVQAEILRDLWKEKLKEETAHEKDSLVEDDGWHEEMA